MGHCKTNFWIVEIMKINSVNAESTEPFPGTFFFFNHSKFCSCLTFLLDCKDLRINNYVFNYLLNLKLNINSSIELKKAKSNLQFQGFTQISKKTGREKQIDYQCRHLVKKTATALLPKLSGRTCVPFVL